MGQGQQGYTPVVAPREGVNDDTVRVLEWLVAEGARVEPKQPVVVLETTKATIDLETPCSGYLFRLVDAGAEIAVGAAVALVARSPERPALEPAEPTANGKTSEDQIVTKKARSLIEEHRLSLDRFAGLKVIRAADVEEVLRKRGEMIRDVPPRRFRGEELDPNVDWEAFADSPMFRELKELLTVLRKQKKALFNRHVPLGSLLYDRWDVAKDQGFGEGTSVYDECLILGDVQIGLHCWVGPFTVLDGLSAPLTIGDYVDIGAGVHIYTHNTIARALTGHRAPLFHKATTIGSCCFLAPRVMIAPGTVIGDHCFVAAGSYVEGTFPDYSYIAGNPARRVGTVEVEGARARIRPFSAGPANPPPGHDS